MQLPHNSFKAAIKAGKPQFGLWMDSASPYMAEIAATGGYDWMLLDGEHAPNSIENLCAQLQAAAPYACHPIIRPVEATAPNVKQLLDIGAQTLLLPMIDTAEQARRMVSALRYPPVGVRGVGAVVARASRWGRIPHYMRDVDQELCLLVQAESRTAVENIDEILAVDGIDGVFIGPADLSASMGHPDDADAPEMLELFEKLTKKIVASGKAAGTLAVAPAVARRFLEWGATFVAVGVDTLLYTSALDAALAPFKR